MSLFIKKNNNGDLQQLWVQFTFSLHGIDMLFNPLTAKPLSR